MKRRFLSILLSAAMVTAIILGGCGNNEQAPESANSESEMTSESGTTSEGAAEGGGSETEDGPLSPYEEPVTITWCVPASAVQKFNDGDTYEDNLWSRKIKEELNIDLEVAFTADSSTDAYRNQLNVRIASGDLPDIINLTSRDRALFDQAYEAGYLADLTDVFEKYATPELKSYVEKFPESFEGATKDGRLMAFPSMTDNFHDGNFLWIRDDWLKAVGAEAPTTVEEMIELARKFTFEDPDGNGIDDTYGLALSKKILDGYCTLVGLADAYGLPAYNTTGIFYRGEDGKITYPYIQPEMKEVLSIAHDLYEEGVIDPEFIVKDNADIEQDVLNGKVGMMYHYSWGDWLPFNLSFEQDGVITRPYPIPTVEGYDFKVGIPSNNSGDVYMVSSNCEHPEAVIKILNLYSKTVLESDDPADFQTYWADELWRLCPIVVQIRTPENWADVLLEAIEKGSNEDLPAFLTNVYNYIIDFEAGTDTSSNAYGTWGQMGERGSVVIALKDYDGHIVTNLMGSERPDIWQQNASILESIEIQAFTDIIIGNQPLDYFDTFVQDWLNAGGQETLDELEKIYAK